MSVICPECGHKFRGRAPVGTGTRKKIRRLSNNKRMLLDLAIEHGEPKTVREFQSRLFQVKMGNRWVRGDKDKPTGRWNYHHVQAELSILVGNDLLCMSRAQDSFDGDMYVSDPTPVYWIDDHQITKYENIKLFPQALARYPVRPPVERGQPPISIG